MNVKPRSSGTYLVARTRDAVYVRVLGLGSMTSSLTFQGFLDEMGKQGYKCFLIDLEECTGVDSTFMGLLAGLVDDGHDLVVLNPADHCRKQMQSVGLDRLLRMDCEGRELPEGVALHELPETAQNPTERLKLVARAHKELIKLDRRNEEKFGAFVRDVVKRLGEDL